MHADQSSNTLLITYDAKQNCYRGWNFLSSGQVHESKGQWDPETTTLNWTDVANEGRTFTSTSEHRFVNDNVFEWSVTTKDRRGSLLFRMEGKSTRVSEGDDG